MDAIRYKILPIMIERDSRILWINVSIPKLDNAPPAFRSAGVSQL